MKKAEKIEKIKPTIEKDNVIKLETQNDEEETQIFEEKIEVEDVDEAPLVLTKEIEEEPLKME